MSWEKWDIAAQALHVLTMLFLCWDIGWLHDRLMSQIHKVENYCGDNCPNQCADGLNDSVRMVRYMIALTICLIIRDVFQFLVMLKQLGE